MTLVTEPLGRPGPHSLHFLVHVASQTSHLVSQRQCWPVHLGLECISLCTLYCIWFIRIHLDFVEYNLTGEFYFSTCFSSLVAEYSILSVGEDRPPSLTLRIWGTVLQLAAISPQLEIQGGLTWASTHGIALNATA